ncbi:hypothetical protein [Listeria monocytogenes]|uniref:Lipoprotein n=1 Tax=Listeria monocytogenes TaxID=1639 RepID=A0A6C8MXH0_LISMN|nr:hypothetical protein [Listeria monocytogenes]KAA9534087.1 hypothetical protein DCK33_08065 [Listeria monocytogenes]KAA9541488.1 hypothetical protein DCK32_10400 [Listeria monocytogenes]
MKKILLACFSLVLLISITACGSNSEKNEKKTTNKKEESKVTTVHKKNDLSQINQVGDYAENDLKTKFTLVAKNNDYTVEVPPLSISNNEANILEISNIANDDFENIRSSYGLPDNISYENNDKLYFLMIVADIKNTSNQAITFNGLVSKVVTPNSEQYDSGENYSGKSSVNDYEPEAKRSGEGDAMFIGKNLSDDELYGEYKITTGETMDANDYELISDVQKFSITFIK